MVSRPPFGQSVPSGPWTGRLRLARAACLRRLRGGDALTPERERLVVLPVGFTARGICAYMQIRSVDRAASVLNPPFVLCFSDGFADKPRVNCTLTPRTTLCLP